MKSGVGRFQKEAVALTLEAIQAFVAWSDARNQPYEHSLDEFDPETQEAFGRLVAIVAHQTPLAHGEIHACLWRRISQSLRRIREHQEKLNEVKKFEKNATMTVRQLEAELLREQADQEKETKIASQEIKELKEELQKNRTISDIEFKFEEKKLRAQEQALIRIHSQMEKKLVEEVEGLQGKLHMEQQVHESAHGFLEDKLSKLQSQKDSWQRDYERETNERELKLKMVEDSRSALGSELNDLKEKHRQEALEHRGKEEEMRMAVRVSKQKGEQLLRMAEAVLFLQEEGRKYMERLAVKAANNKGKKKGKKK